MAELKVKKFGIGKIIYLNNYYLDQLADTYIWIYKGRFRKYLYETYNINLETYYRIVIYGSSSIYPRCIYCHGKNTRWNSHDKLFEGYSLTCSYKCYCSYLSKDKIRFLNSLTDEDRLSRGRLITESMTEETKILRSQHQSEAWHLRWDSLTFEEQRSIINPMINNKNRKFRLFSNAEISKSHKSRFINLGDPNDKCYFYISITPDKRFKFGITEDFDVRNFSGYLSRHKILLITNRLDIAELEYKIKLKLDTATEYLPLNKIGLFREAYRLSYIEIFNKWG